MAPLFLASAIACPCLVLLIECLAACLSRPGQQSRLSLPQPFSLAVLIPAHNEASEIQATLTNLQAQVPSPDRILVVADNCSDNTAALARAAGVTVIERQDATRRGKGYALDAGLRVLAQAPPDVVIVMDADCQAADGAVVQLAADAIASGRPTQAVYLFDLPDSPSPKDILSAFAIKVKNWVRPLGLWQLGGPSLLYGTGMAFPWSVLSSVDMASGHIVEDMKLGFDLAMAGHSPQFCPTAQVRGQLPSGATGKTSQRRRWEHGHLRMLQTYVPRLMWQALWQGRGELLTLALDLAVPPLSLLAVGWFGGFAIATLSGLAGLGWLPAMITTTAGLLFSVAIILTWSRFSRDDFPLHYLLSAVIYVLWKLPLYLAFWTKPETNWIRTERTPNQAPSK